MIVGLAMPCFSQMESLWLVLGVSVCILGVVLSDEEGYPAKCSNLGEKAFIIGFLMFLIGTLFILYGRLC